jgi:hypothetical protein
LLTEITLTAKENDAINTILEKYGDGMESSHKFWAKQRNASKPREDSMVGKKGEFIVAKYIKENFGHEIAPDIQIYTSKKKNWDADLPFSTLGIEFPDTHVKTCSQKTLDYAKTESWTFQMSNGNGFFGTDKLLASNDYDKDLLALVFVPTWDSPNAVIHHLVPWKSAKTFLKDPISPRLKNIKVCLYTKDLEASRKVKNYG